MRYGIIMLPLLLLVFASASAPAAVFAHYPHTSDECSTTEELGTREECLLEQRESGKEVKFVDMYFSEGVDIGGDAADEIPKKLEVAPGDGTTMVVAVMANSGPFELTGMKGWLSLPIGFEAYGRSAGEPAFDTYDLGVPPGATFVFEFPVDVKKNTQVGMYDAVLHVEYFKARDIGMNFREFEVEFLLSGKSVMDARPVTPFLLPSTSNTANIEIVNDGSAPASGLIASVNPFRGGAQADLTESEAERLNQIINVGKKVFDIGVIEPHSKVVIDPILYVNPALSDTRQTLIVNLSYFDSYGEKRTETIAVNFLVSGSPTESIDFSVVTDRPVIRTITETPFTVSLTNTGTETAGSVEVTVNTPLTATVALEQQVPEASRSPISIIGGDGYTRISEIKPSESIDVQVILFASEEAVNTAFQLPVTISYLDQVGGMRQIQRQVSVYVQGTIGLRVYDLGVTYIANEPNLSGYLLNEGTNMALFTTVEIVDDQDKIKAASGSQYLGDLTANSPLPFNIPIRFADGISPDTYPVTIKVSYKDDLRKPFEIEIHGTIPYAPPVIEKNESLADGVYSSLGIFMGVGVASIVGYYFIRKKKRSSALENDAARSRTASGDEGDDDLDFLGEGK